MQKWEYRVFVINQGAPTGDISEMPWDLTQKDYASRGSYGELAKILNRTGYDGWEVCGAVSESTGSLLILKRPMAPAEDEQGASPGDAPELTEAESRM
jgi:hypothetical protein